MTVFPPLRWFRDTVELERLLGHTAEGESFAAGVSVVCSVNRDARGTLQPDGSVVPTAAVVLVPLVQPDGSESPVPAAQSRVTLPGGSVAHVDVAATEVGPRGNLVYVWRLV